MCTVKMTINNFIIFSNLMKITNLTYIILQFIFFNLIYAISTCVRAQRAAALGQHAAALAQHAAQPARRQRELAQLRQAPAQLCARTSARYIRHCTGNLVLRHSVSTKTPLIPTFLRILERKWGSDFSLCSLAIILLPERGNENIQIFQLFEWESNPHRIVSH